MPIGNSMVGGKVARLFPLSGVVLFPGALLPLRIFEPRYKQMTEDALSGDREIVIVLPKSGSGKDPVPIHSVGAAGRIQNERRLANGEFVFDLIGLARVRILEELRTAKPYRQARVALVEEIESSKSPSAQELAKNEILRQLELLIREDAEGVEEYLNHLRRKCDPGLFSDLVAFSTPLPVELKQHLLEEPRALRRLDLLVETAHAVLKSSQNRETPIQPVSTEWN